MLVCFHQTRSNKYVYFVPDNQTVGFIVPNSCSISNKKYMACYLSQSISVNASGKDRHSIGRCKLV